MYDGSALSYEENVANTRIAVNLAKKFGASVEAEIGTLGKRELGYQESEPTGDEPKKVYTNPQDAERFVKETGIDALACSFGTAHGLYLTKPQLDMNVLDEIKKRVDVPLVMHGGSGVSDEDYKTVIEKGIRKINYYTYMAKAGAEAISNKQYSQLHDALLDAEAGMKENVKAAMMVFSNLK